MRKLTVSSMFLYKNSQFQDVEVSSIRLKGKWLAALGFASGCKVEVVEKQGELIIRLLEGEDTHDASQVHNQSGR